ncbi:hypothetical protein WJN01_08255 [Flavobacteriaceae bacterium SZ-1-7]|uniref:hypothetical protein n=1 Tax=Tamlana sedimenti TaxID=3134126 RepID=UPI003126B907
MKLKFIKSEDIDKNVKCAIHKTGKLGFSSNAIDKLSLSTDKTVSIAINEEDKEDENLYVVVNENAQESAFKLSKAGNYFYINTKALFDSFGIDYRNEKIIYDIVDFEYEGEKMYKLIKRVIKKKERK